MSKKISQESIYKKKRIMTNKIVDFLTLKKIPFDLSVKPLDQLSENSQLQIQFDIHVPHIPDFAIFYNTNIEEWVLSSIYELKEPTNNATFNILKNMFNYDKGIFKNIIALTSDIKEDYITEIHLTSFLKLDDFSEEYLEKINDYLINRTDFVNDIEELSKKKGK